MAAVRDDDLPARLHGANQQVGLRLRDEGVILTPDGCDRAGARDYAAFPGFFSLEPS